MHLSYRFSALCVLGLAACQTSASDFTDRDASAVRAQIDTYVSTSLAADWDTWGNTLSADIIFFPPNEAPVVGHDAVMAWIREFPAMTSFTTAIGEVSGTGDLAYAHGTYSLTATLPDGSAMTDQGTWVNIFRLQPDGSWLYTHNIWHSSLPAPAP